LSQNSLISACSRAISACAFSSVSKLLGSGIACAPNRVEPRCLHGNKSSIHLSELFLPSWQLAKSLTPQQHLLTNGCRAGKNRIYD
jgi:hypothetical protein